MFISGRIKTFTIISVMLVLLSAISGCSAEKRLVLSGTIESTLIDANSEVAGKVLSLGKEEGETVKKGDVIAVVDSSFQELAVRQQEAAVKLKQARLDELKAGTRPEEIKQSQAAVQTAEVSVNSAMTGVENSEVNYKYWNEKYVDVKSLSDSGAASQNDLKDAKFKLDSAEKQLATSRKQLESARSQLKSSQARLELLEKGSTNQSVIAAEADLEQSQAVLEQARLTLSKYQVKAPSDGTFITKNVNPGDMVNPGSSTGTVSDLTNLWVSVYIPQKDLSLISLNQELTLVSAGLKDKIIKGRVIFIANEAEFTPKNTETGESKENTVFKLKIKILDNIELLRPGMTVDAFIPPERP